MIHAEFQMKPNSDEFTKVTVSGHAGFDAFGYDVICASVSALVIATINGLEEYVGLQTDVEVAEGDVSFLIQPIDEHTTVQAQTLAHTRCV